MNMKLAFALPFVLLVLALQTSAQRLVLPGDYPDPSVVKIGDTYWASATTSNWAPAYPLLKSKDLVNWQTTGHVFKQKPQWADYYFWAPEITYDNGKVYVYYTAHKKDGNLCIAVASADRPEGPYKDHGPLMCQEVGSIDAFPMRDEKGKLYMIWKEDGNSVGKPTPIWIMEMNEERTALIGEKKELFRNTEQWEANLVEGVSMMRHGDYFYAFYAAAGCCGNGCTYASGVARAKSLLGPWEKYEKNPILTSTEQWKCPGHGTPIEKDGKHYFLYHAYDQEGSVYTGRQGLLVEFRFTPDGWIEFVNEDSASTAAKILPVMDNFNSHTLSHQWQWSVFHNPDYRLINGQLYLSAQPGATGTFLGQKTYDADYSATALLLPRKSTSAVGLGAIGDEKNAVYALVDKTRMRVIVVKDGKENIVTERTISAPSAVHMRMDVKDGKDIRFLWSRDGKNYTALNKTPVDAAFLPPWDRAVRAGLIAKGSIGQKAVFERFEMVNK
jgi:xylan 1,4-beta-xylosidase